MPKIRHHFSSTKMKIFINYINKNMDFLPPELQEKILFYCTTLTIRSLFCTCRKLNSTNQESFWKNIIDHNYAWLTKFVRQTDYRYLYHKFSRYDILVKISTTGEYHPVQYENCIVYIDDIIYIGMKKYIILSQGKLMLYFGDGTLWGIEFSPHIDNRQISCLSILIEDYPQAILNTIYIVANCLLYKCTIGNIIGLSDPQLISLPINKINLVQVVKLNDESYYIISTHNQLIVCDQEQIYQSWEIIVDRFIPNTEHKSLIIFTKDKNIN